MEYKRGGTYCAAQTCNACSKGNPGLSFHTFPKDPSRCKLWVQNVGRQDLEDKDLSALARSYRLCANHFEPNMFMNQNDRKRLVWNAVPTIFEPGYHTKKTNDDNMNPSPIQYVKESEMVSGTFPQETPPCHPSSSASLEDVQKEKRCSSSEEKGNEIEIMYVHPKPYHNYCISSAKDVSDNDLKTKGSSSVSRCHNYAKDPLLESTSDCHNYTKTNSIADDEPEEEDKGAKENDSADKTEGIPTHKQMERGVNTEEAPVGGKLESPQKTVSLLLKRDRIKKIVTIDRGKVKSVLDTNNGRVKTVMGVKDLKAITPILRQGKIKKFVTVKTDQIASVVKKIKANQLTLDKSLITVKHKKLSKSSNVKNMNSRNLGSLSFSVPENMLTKSNCSSAQSEKSRNVLPLSSVSVGDAITPKFTPVLQKSQSSDIKPKKLPKMADTFSRNIGVQTSPLIIFEKKVADKERLKKYNRLIQKHKQRFCRMKKKYDILLGKAPGLQDVGKPTQILRDSAKYLSDYQLLLLGCQLYMSGVQLNGRRYSPTIEGVVNRIFYNHPVAYEFLGKILTLPPNRAIKGWMRSVAKGPGFHEDLFGLLKERVKKMENDNRVCTLQFSAIPVDSKLKQGDGNLAVSTKALCVMVKGIKTEWTQLISYFLLTDETCMVDVLYDIISNCLWKLFDVDVKVKAIVCDESDIARAVYHQFGASPEVPYFFLGELKIYCLYNPTHLLICTRDALKNHDILVEKKMAKWKHIIEFYQKDIKMKIRLAPKLSSHHIAARDCIRTGVKMAAQTMSQTVASGICTHASLESLPAEAIDTANFIYKIDQLFDLLNSRPESGNKRFQKGFQGSQTQMEFLKDSVEWISKWRAVGMLGRTEIQEGWLQTITALTGLWEDLKTQHSFKVLFTRRLNLDSLDDFFNLVKKKSFLEKKPHPSTKHIMDSFRHAAITSLKQIPYNDQCFEELAKRIIETCTQNHNDHMNSHMPPSNTSYVAQKNSDINNVELTCENTESSHLSEPALHNSIQVEGMISSLQNKCEHSHCIGTLVGISNSQNIGNVQQQQKENALCDTEYNDFPSITVGSSENALEKSIRANNENLTVVTSPSHVSNFILEELKSPRILVTTSYDTRCTNSKNCCLENTDQPDISIIPEPLEVFDAKVPVCNQKNISSKPYITNRSINITELHDLAIPATNHPADSVNTEQKYDSSSPTAIVTLEKTTGKVKSLLPMQGEPTLSDAISLTTEYENIAQASAKSRKLNSLSSVDNVLFSNHSDDGNHHMSIADDERSTSVTKTKKIWGIRKQMKSQRTNKMVKERRMLLQDLVKMLQKTYKPT